MSESGLAARKSRLIRRIQWRVVVCQLPLLFVLLAGALYWMGGRLEQAFRASSLQLGQQSAALAASAVRLSTASDPTHRNWDRIADSLTLDAEARIEIVSLAGKVIYASDPGMRGRIRHRFSDSRCVSCHVAGSPRPSAEANLFSEMGETSYRVYATLLRNGRDCRSCHLDEGPKLGSVFIRLPAAPFRRLIRTAQISLLVVGIVALGLSVPMTRVALGRYLGRPRSRPPAAAPARSDSRVESRVAAVAPGGSVARPPGSPPTGAPQRDDLNTLYYIAEQLSRTIAPNVIGRRAVELASSVFGSNCVLIAGHFHADARAFHGTVAYQGPGGEIIERPYPDELVQDNAPFYNVTIVERWLRGELDGVIRFREGSTVAYPLERHGRRLGLILAPARSRNESLDGRPTMAHPDVVEAARKHLAIALELSELERERLLQERLAAIGQTVAGLAHCLKNTLNGLKGGQYVVERALRTEDPEKLRKGWNVLTAGIQHIERLTLDMLIYAGEKSLDRKPANPNEIMQEVIDLYEDSAGGKGVHLRAELDQRMEPVWVDRHALYRAVLNLVTNAIDACVESESGSTVILRSQSRADHVLLTVEDNGVGIPKASLRRVTERFFTTKGSNGTGLGLPVVMKIAEQHGGTLEVESVFGQGSAFHLRIPKGAPSQKSH